MQQYKVLASTSVSALTDKMNSAAKEGWTLAHPLAVVTHNGSTEYVATMVALLVPPKPTREMRTGVSNV